MGLKRRKIIPCSFGLRDLWWPVEVCFHSAWLDEISSGLRVHIVHTGILKDGPDKILEWLYSSTYKLQLKGFRKSVWDIFSLYFSTLWDISRFIFVGMAKTLIVHRKQRIHSFLKIH